MPLYAYKCEDCKTTFEVRHGMFFENQRCIKCHSEFVFRVPSEIGASTSSKEEYSPQKPGEVTKQFIEDTKREIKKEKKSLKNREL
tara:strand:- start:58616 stop:58873 length:258 start_codon:yes stop_codon:yes gene_type:complete